MDTYDAIVLAIAGRIGPDERERGSTGEALCERPPPPPPPPRVAEEDDGGCGGAAACPR